MDLKRSLDAFAAGPPLDPARERALTDECRRVVRAYRDAVAAGESADKATARLALLHLGADGDRSSWSLKDYDHETYGPFLGVSDEGSAAPVIRQASLSSPKAVALGRATPAQLGLGHDAERLGAVGEVPVGPEEYADIWLECVDRVLTTTNVGTRINVRFYLPYPVVSVPRGDVRAAADRVRKDLETLFTPFVNAPGGRARPLDVYVEFDRGARQTVAQQRALLRSCADWVRKGGLVDPKKHHVGLAARIGRGRAGGRDAKAAIKLAKKGGLRDVALSGVVATSADAKVSNPGLLHYLAGGLVGPLLREAGKLGIRVRTKNNVDTTTVARGVWSVLNTARGMGLHLGKYGVFPLTLEEASDVIRQVQGWFADWSAAPVFFVDQGLLAGDRVYTGHDVPKGLKVWLQMVAGHGVPVVLVDTVDKAARRRLLKKGRDELGAVGPKQLQDIDALGRKLKVKVLWAGGLTLAEAYTMGRARVFGIYVTSAAAVLQPVPEAYADDPVLASVKEPSFEGVLRTKTLLEAGFLSASLSERHPELAARLDAQAQALLAAAAAGADQTSARNAEAALFKTAVEGWGIHLSR
jgi:hypothetical protein